MFHLTLDNENNDSDSDKSVIDSINTYVDVYSSSFENNTSKNNSYQNSYVEKYMQQNKYNDIKKIKDSLNIINDDLKFKLLCSQDIFFNFTYDQVLKEMKRIFYSKKQYKLLYEIVINEIKNREIYFYGQKYKNFVNSL